MKITSSFGNYIHFGEERAYACKEQVKLFNRIFPDGANWPDDQEKAEKAGLDTMWLFETFRLTGKARSYYNNEKIEYEINYKNGDWHGVVKRWYSNGKLEYEANFENGRRHGVSSGYYLNGKLESEANYENGERCGTSEWWSHDGKLECAVNYENGQIVGQS